MYEDKHKIEVDLYSVCEIKPPRLSSRLHINYKKHVPLLTIILYQDVTKQTTKCLSWKKGEKFRKKTTI